MKNREKSPKSQGNLHLPLDKLLDVLALNSATGLLGVSHRRAIISERVELLKGEMTFLSATGRLPAARGSRRKR